MPLPLGVEALVRAGHIIAAMIWVGFVLFMGFVRPRAMAGLSESTTREFMPRLAKALMPWMMWSAILTFVFGGIVFWSLGDARGFGNIGWTLQAGIGLATLMLVIGLSVVVPIGHRVARILEGGAPPTPAQLKRMGRATVINGWLGLTVVLLMVLHARFGSTL